MNDKPKTQVQVIKDFLDRDSIRAAIAATAPKALRADRLIRVALSTIARTPKLMQCTKESLYSALVACAEVGLMPDRNGECYLVPYKDVATMQLGYRGIVKLMKQASASMRIEARVVRQNETFSIEYGSNQGLKHIPCLDGDPGEIVGAYWFATVDGEQQFHYMPISQIYRTARDRSQAFRYADSANGKKDSPWHTDPEAMIQKTMIKQAPKFIPLSFEPMFGKDGKSLSDVIAIDTDREVGEGVLSDPEAETVTEPVKAKSAAGKVAQKAKAGKATKPDPEPAEPKKTSPAGPQGPSGGPQPRPEEEGSAGDPPDEFYQNKSTGKDTRTADGSARYQAIKERDRKRVFIKDSAAEICEGEVQATAAMIDEWSGGKMVDKLEGEELDAVWETAKQAMVEFKMPPE